MIDFFIPKRCLLEPACSSSAPWSSLDTAPLPLSQPALATLLPAGQRQVPALGGQRLRHCWLMIDVGSSYS